MKFVVSSSELLTPLQALSRVISSKNTSSILDHFLFHLSDNTLTITASDLETTLQASISVADVEKDGSVAIQAKLLTDSLKEFPEQPLHFEFNKETKMLDISWANGKFNIPGLSGDDYPELPAMKSDTTSIRFSASSLLEGISRSLYATAEEELRPVMNGILFDISEDNTVLVASDAHKLICYTRKDVAATQAAKFILPKKPAGVIKNLLPKITGEITVKFDDKNATFLFPNYLLVCRLVEGNYPAYRSVIPTNNINKAVIDRVELLNSVRRVAVCSNQASNLIRIKLEQDEITVSAQNLDFSVSGYERLSCQYSGDPMEIGFKWVFLAEILSNLPGQDVSFELSDPSRAGLLIPLSLNDANEDICALIMPMMIGS
ncbi:MAG: DNA polymerase III subunit beta [Prevotellaceae bacterium]|jgi:DNA polymerase-3 subunit beta|nr:DNA polymerase III subunit beta [Prevotellaceae bacterium]